MATDTYMLGRKKYQRPQAVLWSDNSGTLINGLYIPQGYEIGANVPEGTPEEEINQFLILSDDNRSEIQFSNNRIGRQQRMINGRMRSYFIADKTSIAMSWRLLPSRSFSGPANFDENGIAEATTRYTSDNGAGGVELLDWYKNHPGPFWMFLSYDNYKNFGTNESAYGNLSKYNEIVQVYFRDFQYSVINRGGTNYDMWDVSVVLEEV